MSSGQVVSSNVATEADVARYRPMISYKVGIIRAGFWISGTLGSTCSAAPLS